MEIFKREIVIGCIYVQVLHPEDLEEVKAAVVVVETLASMEPLLLQVEIMVLHLEGIVPGDHVDATREAPEAVQLEDTQAELEVSVVGTLEEVDLPEDTREVLEDQLEDIPVVPEVQLEVIPVGLEVQLEVIPVGLEEVPVVGTLEEVDQPEDTQ